MELEGSDVISCSHCRTHLTLQEELISSSFHGHNGRAFLFNSAVNVSLGAEEERILMTGRHTVCDVFCVCCDHYLGWKYEKAPTSKERYKVGKFILERKHLFDEKEVG